MTTNQYVAETQEAFKRHNDALISMSLNATARLLGGWINDFSRTSTELVSRTKKLTDLFVSVLPTHLFVGSHTIILRRLRQSDIPEIKRLFLHDMDEDQRYMRFQGFIKEKAINDHCDAMQNKICFVALVGKSIVGTVDLAIMNSSTKLVEFAVVMSKDFCGCGIATAICQHVMEQCDASGVDVYMCALSSNKPMIKLAKKLGFKLKIECRDEVSGLREAKKSHKPFDRVIQHTTAKLGLSGNLG